MKRKLLIILSLLLVCGFCFSACGESKAEYIERMKSEGLITYELLAEPNISFDFQSGKINKLPEQDNKGNEPINEITVKGEKYDLTQAGCSPVRKESTNESKSTLVYFRGINESSQDVRIIYDEASGAPVLYENYSVSSDTFESDIGVENAQSNALKYINNVLNDDYGRNIDIELYELSSNNFSTEHKSTYIFKWQYKKNDFLIHEITIKTTKSGEVFYCECYPIADEKSIERIPDLNDSEYLSIATELLKKGYSRKNDSFTISKVAIDKESKYNEVVYLHEYECYAVRLNITWCVAKEDVDDDCVGFLYLPLK